MKQPIPKEKSRGANPKKNNPLLDRSLQLEYLIHSKPKLTNLALNLTNFSDIDMFLHEPLVHTLNL